MIRSNLLRSVELSIKRSTVFFLAFAFSLCLYSAEDTTALIRQEQDALAKGGREQAGGQSEAAEADYRKALALARQLPPATYHLETEVLWRLGRFYSSEGRRDLATKTYEERLNLLLARQTGWDPDVGTALFDLQSVYQGAGQDQKAKEMMQKATEFYHQCQEEQRLAKICDRCQKDPRLAKACDRRLADVQGSYGDYLFLNRRFEEAEPYLRAVTARLDKDVRPEVLESALLALTMVAIQNSHREEAKGVWEWALALRTKYPGAQTVPLSKTAIERINAILK